MSDSDVDERDTDVDELGPVDYVVVEFPADKANFSGEMAAELSDLIERDLVRVLDLLFLKKNLDGSVEGEPRPEGNILLLCLTSAVRQALVAI